MTKNRRHDIFSACALLCDFEICKSEHVFSVNFLGRSRTYLAYLRSSKNYPAVEALVFLAAKLLDVSAGLLSQKVVTTELRRKAEELRQAGGDILKLAVQQAQALAHFNRMLSNDTSLGVTDSCASIRSVLPLVSGTDIVARSVLPG